MNYCSTYCAESDQGCRPLLGFQLVGAASSRDEYPSIPCNSINRGKMPFLPGRGWRTNYPVADRLVVSSSAAIV